MTDGPTKAEWQASTKRYAGMVGGGTDGCGGVLELGWGSGAGVEGYARTCADVYPQLGLEMLVPSLLSAVSACGQGAFWTYVPTSKGAQIRVPMVVQFMGISTSGGGKSTLLDEVIAPLVVPAMKAGVKERRGLVNGWIDDAMSVGIKVDLEGAFYRDVYRVGVCADSLAESGTPEGVRNKMVRNGGLRYIMTAEPDVLREFGGAYTKDGGSLKLLVTGWDQGSIQVDRAGTEFLTMPEAGLPYCILVQPESFQIYTRAAESGMDQYVERGLFGRTWVSLAEGSVGDEAEFSFDFGDGATELVAGKTLQELELAARLAEVAVRGSEYRAKKAVVQHWENLASAGKQGPVAEPWDGKWEPAKVVLKPMDGPRGRRALEFVQRQRQSLMNLVDVAEAESPGLAKTMRPLVSRHTQHIMRIAMANTLLDDPEAKAVKAEWIEDAAIRVGPWLWDRWSQVMRMRQADVMEDLASKVVSQNSRMDMMGMEGLVFKCIVKETFKLNGRETVEGWAKSGSPGKPISEREIKQRARGVSKKGISPSLVSDLSNAISKTLDEMSSATHGKVLEEITAGMGVPLPSNPVNKTTSRLYRLTWSGLQAALLNPI